MASKASPDVLAAGVVAFAPGQRVLMIHRPRYDDWSFPKGKLDPGEHLAVTAVREAWEETGLHVRLGPPLGEQRYAVAGRRSKRVSYWTARVVGDPDVSAFVPNEEVDQVVWVEAAEAARQLSYDHDRETLRQALLLRRRTVPVVVLRHAQARSRKAWRGDDRGRTLVAAGHLRAQRLVPLLSAFAVDRIVTSSSARCVETVAPFADTTGWAVTTSDDLSEEGARPKRVRRLLDEAVEAAAGGRGTLLCSHRPVLPAVFAALGVEDPDLDPGAFLVAHVRKKTVVATEVHVPPPGPASN